MKFINDKIIKPKLLSNARSINSLQDRQNKEILISGDFYKNTFSYAMIEASIARKILINNVCVLMFGLDDSYLIINERDKNQC